MSPRTANQQESIRAETRERFLIAAMRLFARFGFEQTTVRRIAEEAGVAQGLLYHYFENKDALLRALFERSMQDVQDSFTIAVSGPPAERLERLLRGSFEILQRNREFWQLSYSVRAQPTVVAKLGDALPAWTQTILVTLQGYLQEMGYAEPAVEALVLFALIDGVSQQYVRTPDDFPLDAVVETIVAKYRKGME